MFVVECMVLDLRHRTSEQINRLAAVATTKIDSSAAMLGAEVNALAEIKPNSSHNEIIQFPINTKNNGVEITFPIYCR